MSEASPFDDGDFYDVLFAGLDYGIDFYVGLAQGAKGPILDIACGTGRVLLPCVQAGAEGDGLDLFAPMLATCRRKADALGLTVGLHQGDMADFRLPRKYALVMITFNAFIHNLTQDDQIRCLTRCREHLLPGGVLAFDTFFPGLEYVATASGTRVLEGEMKDPRTGETLRMYDTRTLDRVAQTQHSINEVESEDGKVVHRSEFTTRYAYREEMALLLRVAGYGSWEILGGFAGGPLTKETDGIVVVARA